MSEATQSPAIPLERLVGFLTETFSAVDCPDMAPNGLQVTGASNGVHHLVTGVSACLELFEKAAQLEAQAVLVHHGIFWKGGSEVLTGIQYHRVRELLEQDLALLAFHLPLDRHPQLGNNALILQGLGLEEAIPFGQFDGHTIGYRGRFPEPVEIDELLATCTTFFGQAPFALPFGPKRIETLGVVSGAAERALYEAIDLGLDAFITGEVSEWVMNLAREAGIHFIAAGHYATETFGVRALGEHLGAQLGIDVTFIDLPNPV